MVVRRAVEEVMVCHCEAAADYDCRLERHELVDRHSISMLDHNEKDEMSKE